MHVKNILSAKGSNVVSIEPTATLDIDRWAAVTNLKIIGRNPRPCKVPANRCR